MAKNKWQGGKDRTTVAEAKARGCVFVKRRNTYLFAGFASAPARAQFIAAVAGPGVQVQPQPHRDASLFVARVTAL